MKNIFIILFFLFAWSGIHAQAIVKGTGVLYTNGAPTNPVNVSADAEICIDTVSGLWYEYNRDAGSWAKAGFRVQRKNISIAPTGAPGDKQSEIVINDVDSMYLWRSGAWRHINKVGDASITNEGILGVGAGSGTSSTLVSNTSTSNAVTINAAGILAISESTSSNGGSITLTATEVDGSVSNEGSLTVAAGSGTTSIINSNTSGSTGVTVTAGTGLGISESGNTITLTNSSPDQTVALTGAGITAVTGTYPNFTVTSTEVDGSLSNEGLLGVGAGSGSSAVVVSNTAGANGVTINVAGGLNISETVSSNGGQITIDAGDLDQSAGNEIQTISLSDGTGNDKALDLSLTGGNQVIFRPGTGISLARTDDILTINNTYASVPSGTNNQTLRNSSGAWVANSFLLNTGSAVGIGRTPGKVLDVDGPVRSIGSGGLFSNSFSPTLFLENNSANGKQWYLHSDNDGYLNISESAAGGAGITYWRFEPAFGNAAFGDAGFDKKLNVEGTVRLTNTTGDTPTKVAGLDADGDICEFAIGAGLSISAGVLSATGGGGGGGNYQTWRDDGTGVTQQPNANFVSNADIAFTLTNDGANTETEVTADIPAAAVEFAEMQNISTGSLIGRSTAGSGSPEQITVSTGLGLSGGNLTATDPSLSNEGSLTVAAGTSTTSIINSNTSGQTGITVEAGSGLGVAESGNTITLTNTAPDQTVALTGAGITSVTGTYPSFTVTSTEVDGSITNELQTISNTSNSTSHTVTLSNAGGSVQLVEGANVTLTTTGTGSDGIVTVAVPSTILPTVAATDILIGTGSPGYQSAVFAQFTSSGMDVSGGKPYNLLNTSTGTRNSWQFVNDSTTYFTSSLGGSPFGHYVRGKNLLYYRQYFFFGGNENNVSGFNSEINGVNVITPGSTLTGVVNGVVNETTRKITLINESASNSLIISNQNTASIAANRFSIGSDYTLAAGKMISFVYDKSISRWVFYKPQGDIAPDQVVSLTGAGITAVTGTYPNFTITSTEVDGSVSNEGDLTVGAGSGTTSIINSNTSGSTGVTLTAGTGLGISESGNTITLTNSSPDQTVALTGAGITAVTGTYPNFTITSTEVDGSISNELQTVNNTSDATSHTVTLSNTGGSIQLVEGANVTLTTTGTASDAIVTIAATGGGGGSPVVITPASITVTQNNYSPTGWATATVVFLSNDGVDIWGITGFSSTGFSAGHAKKIFNTSMAQIYIACNHPSSSASNRVSGTQDFILSYGRSVDIVFNGSTWMLSGESADPDLYYTYNPGSVTAGDWGQIAFNAINSGSVNTHTSTDATHPVGLELSTLATTTGGGSISAPKTAGLMRRNTGHSFVESVVRTPSALSDATDSYICGIALGSGNVSALTSVNNIGIRYNHALNSGNWTLYAIDNAGSTTEVNLGVTVAANTRYNLRLELSDDASEGRAYVNGEMKGIISANMPNSGSSLLGKVQMNKAAGTSDRRLIVSKLVTGLHIKY